MPAADTPLRALVRPSKMVVFGSGAPARGLLRNAASGSLAGKIHYVGREPIEMDGVICHADAADLPEPIALAAITSPAADLIDDLSASARAGAESAILYSTDVTHDQMPGLRAHAARLGIRLFGPKAYGCVLPHARINLTTHGPPAPAGNLALVSQSTSVCANILDWNHNGEFGFSSILGYGQSSDLTLPEILDFVAADIRTDSILIYLEGVHDARRFLSAVRAAAAAKPVIVLKGGKSPTSAAAAARHGGAAAGRSDAFDAAMRRAGVLRVHSIGEMFSAARALASPKKPCGDKLAIVANGGSPAIMALDQIARLGIAEARLSATTRDFLQTLKPAPWSRGNPVDLGFEITPECWRTAALACADDPDVDCVLAILTPNSCAGPLDFANIAAEAFGAAKKLILPCVLGEMRSKAARAVFARAGLPAFRTPEHAVSAFAHMVDWVRNQNLMLEMPPALTSYAAPDLGFARSVIEAALESPQKALGLPQAKAVLAAFRIPVTPSVTASSPTEAVAAANRLGYPVAMRDESAQRIQVGLRSAAEVALVFREMCPAHGANVHVEPFVDRPNGRWLRISITRDPVFGPVISLSEAGIASEIYDAHAIALPPLNPRLVGDLLGVPHVMRLLGPLQQKPAVAQAPLRDMLLRVSEMASELPWLHMLDITLEADDAEAVAVHAGIELRPVAESAKQYGHMAIHPYPSQLATNWTLKDGRACRIRPIRPDDAAAFQDFVRGLSAQSRFSRFFASLNELPQRTLARYTQLDYGRELTLLAVADGDGGMRLLGEANYSILPDGATCEFAVVVADDLSGCGLGSRLMRCLMAAAHAQGLGVIRGEVLADNEPMLALMEALDFTVNLTDDEDVVAVWRRLD